MPALDNFPMQITHPPQLVEPMNAKKAKAIRQDLRSPGVDLNDRELREMRHPGSWTPQIVLGNCGRNAYVTAKGLATQAAK